MHNERPVTLWQRQACQKLASESLSQGGSGTESLSPGWQRKACHKSGSRKPVIKPAAVACHRVAAEGLS